MCTYVHSVSTQNPVVDGQGQLSGRRGMRAAQGTRVCCVWRSAGGVISWSLPAAAASDASRRPRRPALRCTAHSRNLRRTHAFRSHRKTRCIVRVTMGGYVSVTNMSLHTTAHDAIPSLDWLPYHFRLKNKAIIQCFSSFWPRLPNSCFEEMFSARYLIYQILFIASENSKFANW